MIRQFATMNRLLKKSYLEQIFKHATTPQLSVPIIKNCNILGVRFLSNEPPTTVKYTEKGDAKILDKPAEDHRQMIKDMINQNKVVIFMKGTPTSPRCGFSNAVVQIFRMHGVSYDAYNVLDDETLREEIKKYTDWPTIPQVFIKGEFLGGCDILLEMHQNGDLVDELAKAGIESDLVKIKKEASNFKAKQNRVKPNKE